MDTEEVNGVSYICGFCSTKVGPTEGYFSMSRENNQYEETIHGKIYICPSCNKPTYVDEYLRLYPENVLGNKVQHLSANIEKLYNEARNCISVNAYTAAGYHFENY